MFPEASEQEHSERGAPGVLEVVNRSGLGERLGRDRMLFNARSAQGGVFAALTTAASPGEAVKAASWSGVGRSEERRVGKECH